MPHLIAILMLACPPWCASAPEIPCRCDCLDADGNGIATVDDVYAVAALVWSGSPLGDVNADGTADPDDIADFIAAFFACAE